MKRNLAITTFNLLILCLAFFAHDTARAEVTIDAADYGLSESGDASQALFAAIQACKEQDADRLIIPRGVYKFYPLRAFQKYCAISNNDNGMKHIAMPLIGFEGLRIDGQGSEFIMHGHMMAIVIENSKNILIENLIIDWAQPFHFQASVVAVDKENSSIDLEPMAECNVSIQGRALVHSERTTPPDGGKLDNWWTPWRQDLRWSLFFDEATKAPATGPSSASGLPWKMLESADYRAEKIGENRYRLTNACRQFPEVGTALVAKGMLRHNRLSPAIRLYKAFDVTLQDVTVHHAGGMGLIGERSGDITLNRFAVRLRPGSKRLVSTTADATHFVGCKGLIRLEDCYFENMLDDATNVHGTYTRIEERTGPRSVLAKLMHFQQFGFTFAEAGDLLRFSSRKSLVPYAKATARKVRLINEQYMEITFDRPLDGFLADDSVLDNLSWQADVKMTGCTVSRNRARSILLSTAGDILIEGNTFDRSSMMNILMEGDAFVWHESCPTRNVRIVGNRFIDLNPTAEMIRISPKFPKGVVPEESYHKNIVIEDNTFETLSPKLVVAAHAGDLAFRNNKIIAAKGYGETPGNPPAFTLENCHGVTITGNDCQLDKPVKVAADKQSSGVTVSDNKNIE